MTLGELREMINDLERREGDSVLNMSVYAEYDYGDHSHTRALVYLRDVQIQVPHESAYSDSGLAISHRGDDDADDIGDEVVVLTTRGGC
jgi:hypothetical protein